MVPRIEFVTSHLPGGHLHCWAKSPALFQIFNRFLKLLLHPSIYSSFPAFCTINLYYLPTVLFGKELIVICSSPPAHQLLMNSCSSRFTSSIACAKDVMPLGPGFLVPCVHRITSLLQGRLFKINFYYVFVLHDDYNPCGE